MIVEICHGCGGGRNAHEDGKGGVCGSYLPCVHVMGKLAGQIGKQTFVDDRGLVWWLQLDTDGWGPVGWVHRPVISVRD